MLRRLVALSLAFAAASALLAPSIAAADEPDAIADPPAAFEPAAPADTPTLDLAAASTANAAGDEPRRSQSEPSHHTAPARSAVRTPQHPELLPFTGMRSDIVVLVGLFGSVLMLGGLTLLALPCQAEQRSS